MKLSNMQMQALAEKFRSEVNAVAQAHNEKVKKGARSRWSASKQGKEWAKVPAWVKQHVSDWEIRRHVDEMIEGQLKPVWSSSTIKNEIVIATIESTSVEQILAHLKKKFKL